MTTIPEGYIRDGYMWAPGSHQSGDANDVVAEFDRIMRELGADAVALKAAVVRARMADSPLFSRIEHDSATAHDAHNENEIAAILRAVRIRYINLRTEEEEPGPRAYLPVRTVTDNPDRPGEYMKVLTVARPRVLPPPSPPHTFAIEEPVQAEGGIVATPPRTVAPHWTGTAAEPPPLAVVRALPATERSEMEHIRLTESRERARRELLRWANTLERDSYFADVVAAIRALH